LCDAVGNTGQQFVLKSVIRGSYSCITNTPGTEIFQPHLYVYLYAGCIG